MNRDATIETLCDAIMRAVAELLARSKRRVVDYDQASKVMRAEVMEFLTGPRYENERACILAGTVHQNYVLASVVASIIWELYT